MPIAEHQHRVQVAERVENTDPQTLQVVTNLTGDGAGDRMSSAEIQAVLAVFTQSLLDSGPKSPANLHKELDDAIIEVMAVQDPEAYPPDSDDPEDWAQLDEGAALTLAELTGPRGFMAVRANPDTGDVELTLPVLDIMSMSNLDVYSALDEGCNSTCHSQQWAEMCNNKLAKYGVTFKWVNHDVTSFVGIGAKTGTCGSRSMPIGLEALDGSVIKGKLESYEIQGNTSTPLLLSLYAQVTLGMIKDLSAGKVFVTVNNVQRELPLAKCSKTGLLPVNLTSGIRTECNKLPKHESPAQALKFLRPFRPAACVANMDRGHVVFQFNGDVGTTTNLEGQHNCVSIVTGGELTRLSPRQADGKVILPIDVRETHDPDGGTHRSHIGRNHHIIGTGEFEFSVDDSTSWRSHGPCAPVWNRGGNSLHLPKQ